MLRNQEIYSSIFSCILVGIEIYVEQKQTNTRQLLKKKLSLYLNKCLITSKTTEKHFFNDETKYFNSFISFTCNNK